MDMLQLLILIALGLLGGVISGLAGVSSGGIFVPALVYAAGWEIKEAVAASLVIIAFSSLSGTLRNARSEDPVNWQAAALLSSSVAPASLIGVAISRISSETVVQVAFAALLLILAYPVSRNRPKLAEGAKKIPLPVILLAGIGIGTFSGLVGIGGGVMLVPLMVLGFGLRIKAASSTSLAIMLFTGIVGSLGYIVTGFNDPLILSPLIVGSMLGAWLGVRLRDVIPEAKVRRGFTAFMVVVALRVLADAMSIL